MGLFDKIRGEFVDIIEWVDDSHHTLVWRFPRYQNEIKNGAQLIVRPGQVAIFVRQGEVADVFEPGHYELTTKNLPILSTLAGWKHGFDSPFRAEVYFVSTRQITGLKWGTPNPLMLRDAEFGPVRVRAFGTYVLRAEDPVTLLNELVGTDSNFDTGEVAELMRSIINQAFADVLGKCKIPVLDLAANYNDLAALLQAEVVDRVDDEYGLEIPQLFIVNISLPEAVEKAMDTRASMGVIGDMNTYQNYQMGKAITAAAENPGGGMAGDMMGMGVGMAMAQQMIRPGQFTARPPPPPAAIMWHVAEGGKTHGPISQSELMTGVSSGRYTHATMVWCEGMSAWQKIGDVSALSSQTPPPPPPA